MYRLLSDRVEGLRFGVGVKTSEALNSTGT